MICNAPPPRVSALVLLTKSGEGEFAAEKSKAKLPALTARPPVNELVAPPSVSAPEPVFVRPFVPAIIVLRVADWFTTLIVGLLTIVSVFVPASVQLKVDDWSPNLSPVTV